MDRLEAMRMPTLCALNGGVYGGATDMALACDFRLGVKGMRFFMPAARFGLHYYPSGLRRYTQKVSPSFAKRAFLLSEEFTDEDLLRVGYLDWLVDRPQFKAKVDETAAKLAGLAPLSMVEHEARHRAVRPGRARHPEDSRGHPRVPDLGGPARRPEPRCASAGRPPSRAADQEPSCNAVSPPSFTPTSPGFTRMMEGAETRTFRHLKSAQIEVWRPAIDAGSGRLVGTAGDAMLAEFGSAVTAVGAAIDIQERMARFNEALEPSSSA